MLSLTVGEWTVFGIVLFAVLIMGGMTTSFSFTNIAYCYFAVGGVSIAIGATWALAKPDSSGMDYIALGFGLIVAGLLCLAGRYTKQEFFDDKSARTDS